MRRVGAVIFPDYELLDLYGPLEMFGMYPERLELRLVAEQAGPVASAQGPRALPDDTFETAPDYDILLVPGGQGTRREVANETMISWLRERSEAAELVSTVCTGSALLAKTGLLDGRKATTNKRAFHWVAEQGPKVDWQVRARWVEDGKFLTASGVSAGTDMSLALLSRLYGPEAAEQAALWGEYTWHRDAAEDPFCDLAGLA